MERSPGWRLLDMDGMDSTPEKKLLEMESTPATSGFLQDDFEDNRQEAQLVPSYPLARICCIGFPSSRENPSIA